MTERNRPGARSATLWQRMAGVWRRTDRARAIAQIPMVALSPAAGPVADQVRLAPPADLTEIRREADLEHQEQWAHHELHRIEDRTAYIIRDHARDADRAAHEHDR